MRISPIALAALAAASAGVMPGAIPARAQGTRCSQFLHNHDGSWTSFTDDEMLLPRGPLPIHKGERFSRRAGGAKAFVARILDDQCRLDSPDY